MPEQQGERGQEGQSGTSRISIGSESYETGKKYYVPGEGLSITLEKISVSDSVGIYTKFTLKQDLPGQDPQVFKVGANEMLRYDEDKRTGAPLSHERAKEIRECDPGALKVRNGGGTTPTKEAQVVRAAFDMILRK